jgi:hypothetical protein
MYCRPWHACTMEGRELCHVSWQLKPCCSQTTQPTAKQLSAPFYFTVSAERMLADSACRATLLDVVPVLLLGLTDNDSVLAHLCLMVLLMQRPAHLLMEVQAHV